MSSHHGYHREEESRGQSGSESVEWDPPAGLRETEEEIAKEAANTARDVVVTTEPQELRTIPSYSTL